MSELFVMRRADGHFFTEEINGRLRLPIWSGEEAALRYRERNPELGVFLPQRFSRVLLEKLVVLSERKPRLSSFFFPMKIPTLILKTAGLSHFRRFFRRLKLRRRLRTRGHSAI